MTFTWNYILIYQFIVANFYRFIVDINIQNFNLYLPVCRIWKLAELKVYF